jgi:YD repeat-containing protein
VRSIRRAAPNARTNYVLNLDGQRQKVLGGPVEFEYTFDKRGLVELAQQGGDVTRYNTFEHDALGRLVGARYRRTQAEAPFMEETYRYDAAGNRLQKERPNDGKFFNSVFDLRPHTTPPTPANNLLRVVLDPSADEVCSVDGGRPAGCKKSQNADLAGVEAGWKELLREARDLIWSAPSLSEVELRGRIIAWVEKQRAWQTEFNLSGQTLMLLLLSSESGPHEFMETLNSWLDRRAAGLVMDGTDFDLLKRMLSLAEKVQVRKAVVMDPNWYYQYDAAGNVTEVMLDTPELGLVKPLQTFFCYRHDAQRRLVKVEWTSRLAPLPGANPPSPCISGTGLRVMAEYRFDSRNLRTYSNVLGLETHFLFSPQGQLLAEAMPSGMLQKQYLYLDGEPFVQVALFDGIGVNLPRLPPGCSSAGGSEDEVLFVDGHRDPQKPGPSTGVLIAADGQFRDNYFFDLVFFDSSAVRRRYDLPSMAMTSA